MIKTHLTWREIALLFAICLGSGLLISLLSGYLTAHTKHTTKEKSLNTSHHPSESTAKSNLIDTPQPERKEAPISDEIRRSVNVAKAKKLVLGPKDDQVAAAKTKDTVVDELKRKFAKLDLESLHSQKHVPKKLETGIIGRNTLNKELAPKSVQQEPQREPARQNDAKTIVKENKTELKKWVKGFNIPKTSRNKI